MFDPLELELTGSCELPDVGLPFEEPVLVTIEPFLQLILYDRSFNNVLFLNPFPLRSRWMQYILSTDSHIDLSCESY